MNSNYMLVKTSYPPEGLDDILELDADTAFIAADYQSLADRLFQNALWKDEEGRAESIAGPVGLQPTDAGLLISFEAMDVSPDAVRALAAQALESGAVLMNADTAEIISAE